MTDLDAGELALRVKTSKKVSDTKVSGNLSE